MTRRVARELRAPANELWLSPLSIWELVLLADRGRVRLDRGVEAWIAQADLAAPTREAPLTREIALESRRLDLPHEDPADRFIAATARVMGLTLVTADERLLGSRRFATLPNR